MYISSPFVHNTLSPHTTYFFVFPRSHAYHYKMAACWCERGQWIQINRGFLKVFRYLPNEQQQQEQQQRNFICFNEINPKNCSGCDCLCRVWKEGGEWVAIRFQGFLCLSPQSSGRCSAIHCECGRFSCLTFSLCAVGEEATKLPKNDPLKRQKLKGGRGSALWRSKNGKKSTFEGENRKKSSALWSGKIQEKSQ